MTRQHFQALAITFGNALRQVDQCPDQPNLESTVAALQKDIMRVCKTFNSAFRNDDFQAFVDDVRYFRRDLDGRKIAAKG